MPKTQFKRESFGKSVWPIASFELPVRYRSRSGPHALASGDPIVCFFVSFFMYLLYTEWFTYSFLLHLAEISLFRYLFYRRRSGPHALASEAPIVCVFVCLCVCLAKKYSCMYLSYYKKYSCMYLSYYKKYSCMYLFYRRRSGPNAMASDVPNLDLVGVPRPQARIDAEHRLDAVMQMFIDLLIYWFVDLLTYVCLLIREYFLAKQPNV